MFILILTVVAAGFFCCPEVKAVEKININTATLEELDTLPEIGPAKAQEIINYRASHGPFLAIAEIMNVSGIKQATFDKIKDLITVGQTVSAPVCGNGVLETGEACDDGNVNNGDGCDSSCQTETAAGGTGENAAIPPDPPLSRGVSSGEVVINELVSDPADDEVEWIELYNNADREIDLTGWWLEDGSKAKTKLSGIIKAGGSGRYQIIEQPKGNLNNSGDLVMLYTSDSRLIDRLAYGDWDDGNLNDNAPVAHDPDSLARLSDGYNTFNNADDFAVTDRTTKGSSNLIQTQEEGSAAAKASFDFSDRIYLWEILPNPSGNDAQGEFIEIFNADSRAVNLTGWSLSNEDGKKINFEKFATSTIIQAGEYLAFFRPATKLVLHNDQGEARLFQPLADQPLRAVSYQDVKEGWSYDNAKIANYDANAANNANADWVWSKTPTPGAANIITAASQPLEADFGFPDHVFAGQPVVFDSSDTLDSGSGILKYSWDFGDGFKNTLANPEHTFFQAGAYQVQLTVSNDQETATKEKSLVVAASATPLALGEKIILSPALAAEQVIFNELLPNPAGADTGQEWLELKNPTGQRINLLNWRVENENGKYKFKNDLWLEAGGLYLLSNSVSKLALKNSADTVSLYDGAGEPADQVQYMAAAQGEAYARGQNDKWFWTTKLTPGRENEISVAGSRSGAINQESGIEEKAEDYMEVDLDKVGELASGDLVKAQGVVAVLPGILGAQFFYIVSGSAGSSAAVASSSDAAVAAGVQIYNYKKDFPELKVGDSLIVSGEISQAQGEARIKTKSQEDMAVISHGPAPTALALACDQLSEENVGQLISLTGEITEKKSVSLYLDDGSGELLIYFKKTAGLSTAGATLGQTASVTGILTKTSTGLRLLPRSPDDLDLESASGPEPQVLGASAAGDDWALAERNKKVELFKYLLIISGGVIMVLVGLLWKVKKRARETGK